MHGGRKQGQVLTMLISLDLFYRTGTGQLFTGEHQDAGHYLQKSVWRTHPSILLVAKHKGLKFILSGGVT